MSLTRELDRPDSPVSRWMAEHFAMRPILREVRDLFPTDTIAPKRWRSGSRKDWPWMDIGTAVDYRLRQRYGIPWSETHAEWTITHENTMHRLATESAIRANLITEEDAYFTIDPIIPAQAVAASQGIAAAMTLLWPATQSDPTTTPDTAALMWGCAFAEENFRSFWRRDHPVMEWTIRLFDLTTDPGWEDLIQAVQPSGQVSQRAMSMAREVIRRIPVEQSVLTDIASVCDAATSSPGWQELLDLMKINFVENPVFAGSRDVGGADADLIVDHALVEIKTTISPSSMARSGMRQLIGYAALDYRNEWQLDQLGFFLPRQYGTLVRFPLALVLKHSDFPDRRAMQRSLEATLTRHRAERE